MLPARHDQRRTVYAFQSLRPADAYTVRAKAAQPPMAASGARKSCPSAARINMPQNKNPVSIATACATVLNVGCFSILCPPV